MAMPETKPIMLSTEVECDAMSGANGAYCAAAGVQAICTPNCSTTWEGTFILIHQLITRNPYSHHVDGAMLQVRRHIRMCWQVRIMCWEVRFMC